MAFELWSYEKPVYKTGRLQMSRIYPTIRYENWGSVSGIVRQGRFSKP